MRNVKDFQEALTWIDNIMANANEFHPMRWQALEVRDRPEAKMMEQVFVNFSTSLTTESLDYYRTIIKPNLPWADNHFEKERVSGEPLNPGETYKEWPSANASMALDWANGKQFNHSYAERYWPKFAGLSPLGKYLAEIEPSRPLCGIRHEYGDLAGVVRHLVKEPTTRQAYLPVWFPEDTGDSHNGRKPCSIGYHFIMRNGRLHITYQIRSCDFVRHLRDDIYLTVRLLLWVLDECRKQDRLWFQVKPGFYRMDIGSLHCFVNEHRAYFNAA